MRVTSSHLAVLYQEVNRDHLTWLSKVNMEWVTENQDYLAVCFYLNISLSESITKRLMQTHNKKPQGSVWLYNTTGLQTNTVCFFLSAYVNHPSEFFTNIASYFISSNPAETINLELKWTFSQKCLNVPLNMCMYKICVNNCFSLMLTFWKIWMLLQNDSK